MFATPEFWVAIAFFIFMAIVWRMGAFAKMFGAVDARGARIRAELDEARRLREEAAALLAGYQRRRTEAEAEATQIVAAAREEAERLGRDAHERMTEFVARRTAAAEAKIAQAESQATQQVRDAATEAAVKVSETVLREQVRGAAGEEMLSRSLAEIRTKLHS